MNTNLPKRAVLNYQQKKDWDTTLAAFMKYCAFFSYLFYDQMEEYPTLEVDTLATDGKRLFFNPEYITNLLALERAFAACHEVYHVIWRDPQRMIFYQNQGHVDGLPFDPDLMNRAMDYRINADLIDNGLGLCNPAWLYDPEIKASDTAEVAYKKLYKKQPPQPTGPGNGPPKPGGGGGSTYGQHRRVLSRPDKTAQANGGSFDQVLAPAVDQVTGETDLPSEMEFKEAIARALDNAEKSQGKIPGNIKRLCREILEPQVDWRDHIRMLVTGKIGHRGETWEQPNRRRLVLSALGNGVPVYMPGRRRYGAELVVCAVDNSGSVSQKEMDLFFAEMGGILADCRPRRVIVIWCDAAVQRVAECDSLEELGVIRKEGSPGGGGTSFIPPFDYVREHHLRPDAFVYLTDMGGSFPAEAPVYPTIWAKTTDLKAPWGEEVRVKL